MSKIFLLSITLLIALTATAAEPREDSRIESVFVSYGAEGSVLMWDRNANLYTGYNLERCTEGFLPASTFKIPNTLIALETGVATPETVFRWDGSGRAFKSWERDVNFAEAHRLSVVPVYQDIARRIGPERMRYYLSVLDYGDMDVSATDIDKFWLGGNSRITQYRQVNFLTRLYEGRLPVGGQAMNRTKQIMFHERGEDYILSGKTGWATQGERDIMWYVGWLETGGNAYIFALNVEPAAGVDANDFSRVRIEMTKEIFARLEILKPAQ
ncbi:MAG: hypothetical protein LUD76_05165 [Alistipes sp.]|nr:hypothetical protein [Alistipes sp.]